MGKHDTGPTTIYDNINNSAVILPIQVMAAIPGTSFQLFPGEEPKNSQFKNLLENSYDDPL